MTVVLMPTSLRKERFHTVLATCRVDWSQTLMGQCWAGPHLTGMLLAFYLNLILTAVP